MASPIMKYFGYLHLHGKLQEVSKPICELAIKLDAELPDGAEKSAGLPQVARSEGLFRANIALIRELTPFLELRFFQQSRSTLD